MASVPSLGENFSPRRQKVVGQIGATAGGATAVGATAGMATAVDAIVDATAGMATVVRCEGGR